MCYGDYKQSVHVFLYWNFYPETLLMVCRLNSNTQQKPGVQTWIYNKDFEGKMEDCNVYTCMSTHHF